MARAGLSSPRLDVAGAQLRLLVLAERRDEYLTVDLDSGAFVRAHGATSSDRKHQGKVFEVIKVEIAGDGQQPTDLSQPEAVAMAGPPQPARRVRRGRIKRYLRALVAPPREPLLGFAASATPYWTLNGTRPSLALIEPQDGPHVSRRADDSLWSRFRWGSANYQMPVDNPYLSAALGDSERARVTGRPLAKALGFRPHYLLVALAPPRDGHCYKTLAAVLPKN